MRSQKLVVFTGAGISTESGIPDFRSPGGVWDRYDASQFTLEKFMSSADIRKMQWQIMLEGGMGLGAKPNAAHLSLGELHRMGKLDCVVTQNIDFLHQQGGVPDSSVFEVHGTMRRAVCMQCGRYYPIEQVKKRLDDGDGDPHCEACRGILKPDVVMFGESLPESIFQEASQRSASCDMIIVIGSSLVVYPAAMIPYQAIRAGAKLVIINLSETPLDDQAEVLIQARAGETLERVMPFIRQNLSRS
jgi:NAD-dependent deacetylase